MEAYSFERKIKTREELLQILTKLKEGGKKIVFTNGSFDMINAGHVYSLAEAKLLGDILIVGLNSDASVKGYKDTRRPLFSEDERAAILAGLQSVDYVCIFDELTPEKLVEYLKPDIDVKGGDYTEEQMPEAKVVRAYGGKVVIQKGDHARHLRKTHASDVIKKIVQLYSGGQ